MRHPAFLRFQRLTLAVAVFWAVTGLSIATHPSWVSSMAGGDRVVMLGAAGFWTWVLAVAAQAVCETLGGEGPIFGRRKPSYRARSMRSWVAAVPVALVATTLAFVTADDFSYTMFRKGVAETNGALAWLVSAFVLAAFGLFLADFRRVSEAWSHFVLRGVTAALVAFGAYAAWSDAHADAGTNLAYEAKAPATRPNVLLISIDGLNAERTSVYGYPKATTPFLARMASRMDVYEDHFPANCCTIGTLSSLWTGKMTLTHKVVYPPATLKGAAAAQHLPGILRRIGYETHQIGVEHYADAFRTGVRGGFDTVNFASLSQGMGRTNPLRLVAGGMSEATIFLLTDFSTHLHDKVEHLAGGKALIRPMSLVQGGSADQALPTDAPAGTQDGATLSRVKDVIADAQEPWFIHVHMMGTHGTGTDAGVVYAPRNDVFTKDVPPGDTLNPAFYDGAILDADRDLEGFFAQLPRLWDSTWVIVTSDHDAQWATDKPVPLMIHAPGQSEGRRLSGKLSASYDVAPTILDALGLPWPSWMDGTSLAASRYRALPVDRRLWVNEMARIVCDDTGCHAVNADARPFGMFRVSMRVCDMTFAAWLAEKDEIASFVDDIPADPAPRWEECRKAYAARGERPEETIQTVLKEKRVIKGQDDEKS